MAAVTPTAAAAKVAIGGLGCSVAGFVTNPVDVVKIRNQQFSSVYGTFFGAFRKVAVEEGPRGLLKGAGASVIREATYSGVRMGMYEPIKTTVVGVTGANEHAPVTKWGSAFLSGAIGSAIFNPLDLVKVRFQSQLPGQPRPYSGVVGALRAITKTEGISGLYKGVGATVGRAALLTMAQLGTYDVIKNNVLVERLRFEKEARRTHFTASLITSLIATTASNPPDVVKTRVMNDAAGAHGGSLRTAVHILRAEGPRAFFRGWTASYLRIGPHTIISFVIIENVRKAVGMNTM